MDRNFGTKIGKEPPTTVMYVNRVERYCQPCFTGGQGPLSWWCNPWKKGDYQFAEQYDCNCIKNSIRKAKPEPKYHVLRDDTWPFNCDPIHCAKSCNCSCFSKIICGKTICYQRPCCRYRLKHPIYRLPDDLGKRFHVPHRVFNPPKASKPPVPYPKCTVHCPFVLPPCTCRETSCQCPTRKGSKMYDSCLNMQVDLSQYPSLDLFESRDSAFSNFLETEFPCPTRVIRGQPCYEKPYSHDLKSCQEIMNERQRQQQSNVPFFEIDRNENPFVKYRKLWQMENEALRDRRCSCQSCYYVDKLPESPTVPTILDKEEKSSDIAQVEQSGNISAQISSGSSEESEGDSISSQKTEIFKPKTLQVLYTTDNSNDFSKSALCFDPISISQEQCKTNTPTGMENFGNCDQYSPQTITVNLDPSMNQSQVITTTIPIPSQTGGYTNPPPDYTYYGPNMNPQQNENINNQPPNYIYAPQDQTQPPNYPYVPQDQTQPPYYCYAPPDQPQYYNGYYYPDIPSLEQPQYYPCYPSMPEECPVLPCNCQMFHKPCPCRRPKVRYNSRVLHHRPCQNCPDTHFELDPYIRGLQALITTYDPFLSPFSPMRKKLYARAQRIPPKLLSARRCFSITKCICDLPPKPDTKTPYSRGRSLELTCRCIKPKCANDLIEEMRRWKETWTGRKMDLCPDTRTCKCQSRCGCP